MMHPRCDDDLDDAPPCDCPAPPSEHEPVAAQLVVAVAGALLVTALTPLAKRLGEHLVRVVESLREPPAPPRSRRRPRDG